MFKKKANKLYSLYRKTVSQNTDMPLDFRGHNWESETVTQLAILVGFNPWKRDVISAYLKNYKTAYLMGKPTFFKLKRFDDNFIKKIDEKKITFFIWGKKDDFYFKRYLDSLKIRGFEIRTIYVEDGFLRSINSGVLHSRPASLVFDSKANHFESKETDLERLLSNYQLNNDEKLKSTLYMEIFKSLRITKYFDPTPFTNKEFKEQLLIDSVLVLGQVEDDASVIASKSKIKNNKELISLAIKENPGKKVYFRPHPDYYAKIRNGEDKDKVYGLCDVISPAISIFEIFNVVDKVYTISSLAGFEAALHNKKVIVLGTPFYSGWGFTDDRSNIKRRSHKRTLAEAFYIVYVKYPEYLSLVSNETSNFIETVTYFIVETLKYKVLSEIACDELFINAEHFKEELDVPFKVLSYIVSTNEQAAADTCDLLDIIGNNNKLKHFEQISTILVNSSNYDQLVHYTNLSLRTFEDELQSNSNNLVLYANFLESVCYSQKNSNGRVIDDIPSIDVLLDKRNIKQAGFQKLLKFYVLALSNNLQYDLLRDFLDWLVSQKTKKEFFLKRKSDINQILNIDSLNINNHYYSDYINLLNQKPSRSERNSDARNVLVIEAANYYLGAINSRYKSIPDSILNQLGYFILLGQSSKVTENLIKLVDYYGYKQDKKLIDFDISFVVSRRSDLIKLANYLFKNYYYSESSLLLKSIPNDESVLKNNYTSYIVLRLSLFKRNSDYKGFFSFYKSLPSKYKSSEKVMQMLAKVYREIGMFEKSKNIIAEMLSSSRTLARRVALQSEIDKLEFCQQTSSIINAVPQPKLPKGVVFLASQTCFNTLAMITPVILELKKQGFAFINLTAGMTLEQPVGIPYIDKLQGIIPLELTNNEMHYDWIVNWETKRVETQNINFYQGFYERLSTSSRRFFVDINRDPMINKEFYNTLRRADTCLYAAKSILDDVVSKGLPSIILSGNTHVTPFSVFRDFSMYTNSPLLSFVNCNVAYEAYFSNLGSKFANTMCVTDMTLYPTIRAPFMAREDQFNSWFERNQENPEYINKANDLLSLNRVGSTTNDKELEIISYLKEKKKQGKKIICAFGKVPVDLNVPFDGGPAHKNMSDWITHTVQVCNQLSDDVILLVKPHPHELRPEIALDLVESFEDLIQCELGNNIRVLGHKDINGQALVPYLDLALLYNGSSGIEMTAQGIPVMMTSYFGNYDYPVDLLYPKDRAHYEQFISLLDYPNPSLELRKRAAFLLCYLGTEEISIINQYSKRQLTNDRMGYPKWRMKKINEFLKNGDPKMELAARRITEKARLALSKEDS